MLLIMGPEPDCPAPDALAGAVGTVVAVGRTRVAGLVVAVGSARTTGAEVAVAGTRAAATVGLAAGTPKLPHAAQRPRFCSRATRCAARKRSWYLTSGGYVLTCA